MQELILGILRKIELDKEYIKLCRNHYDFDGRANLNREEVEPIIKSFDSDFKYAAKDKTFLKEIAFGEFTLRFFIGFKNGIIDFVSQTPIELLIDFINIALLNKQEFENELKLTEFITKMIKAVSECEEDDNNHPLEDIFEDELNSKFLKEGFLVNEEILSIISKN